MLGRSDAEPVAKLVGIAPEQRREDLVEHLGGIRLVLAHPGPHRREPVWEPCGIAAALAQLLGQGSPGLREPVGRRVVRRGQPAVGEAGDPAEAGVGPQLDPQRDPTLRDGRRQLRIGGGDVLGRRDALSAQQGAQDHDGFLEALPALVEREPDRVIVAIAGTGAPPRRLAAPERMSIAASDFASDRARTTTRETVVATVISPERWVAAARAARPVEPWRGEDEVVVRRDCGEAALARGIDRPHHPLDDWPSPGTPSGGGAHLSSRRPWQSRPRHRARYAAARAHSLKWLPCERRQPDPDHRRVAGGWAARDGSRGAAAEPGLVLFLGLGMAIGSDGTGWIDFADYELARTIGVIALALILFEGGLAVGFSEVRPVLGASVALAILGTVLTAAIAGLAASWLAGFSVLEGLLVGSIVSATDGAAIFGLLRDSSLRPRIARTLEGGQG